MDRLHVHIGRVIDNRPVGLRPGSEVDVVIDGNQCGYEGVIFYRSDNGAILTECFEGKIPKNYIGQVYQLRDGKLLYTRPGRWIDATNQEEDKNAPQSHVRQFLHIGE